MTITASIDTFRNIRKSLHDLSQPLAAVMGLVDLLLLETEETDPKMRDFQLISEQMERVLEIVGEVRRLAREASGAETRGPEGLAHAEPR